MMSKVILDSDLRKKLHDLKEPIDLIDESGRLVGQFLPIDFDDVEPMTSDELARRLELAKNKTYSTEEVLKHLENLDV